MIKTNRISVLFSAILIFFNSEIVLAVETTDSSSSILLWPLIVLFVILAVFAKKLISEATPEQHESDHHESPEQVTPAVAAPEQASPAVEPAIATDSKKKPKAKAKKAKKAKTETIDLRDGKEQCQGSTTKGTRCKRTNTLEDTSVTIDGTRYQITVCNQHNNDKLKPFSELIK